VDKGLRSLRIQRKDAQLIIGLERQYVGHTTAAARSLSDPAGFQTPFAFFDWPLVSHPSEVGVDETLMQIKKIIDKEGADNILALTLELVGERSGYVLSDEFLAAADTLRAETGIPLVFVESAGALGRNGKSIFVTDTVDVTPNMVLWYTGAQLGQIFVDDHYYVAKPLTLISTWDGDEVCMRRTLCHLREAQIFVGKEVAAAFTAGLQSVAKDVKINGAGLWQVLDFGDSAKAETFLRACYDQGLRLGRGLPGRVVVAPSLVMDEAEMKKGLKIIAQAL
jgi:acetylornithine/succinyldiaminopimelate/putrescine aminotransferase